MSELQHHGVLGMKWGIRRYQPYGEGYTPKDKRGVSRSTETKGNLTIHKTQYKNDNISSKNKMDRIGTEKWLAKNLGLSKQEAKLYAEASKDDYEVWAIGSKEGEKFQRAAFDYVDTYEKKGREAAEKMIHKKLKDYSYELSTLEEYSDSGKEVYYVLRAEANRMAVNMIIDGSDTSAVATTWEKVDKKTK